VSYAFPLHIDWHCRCGDAGASHQTRADREECVGHCQRTERDCQGRGYRPIPHTERTPAIEAIFTAAGSSEQRWPRYYTMDLSTDYQALMRDDAPQRFLWILRESGTELYPLDSMNLWTKDYVRTALRWQEENHPEAHVFHWNGFTLDPVSYETAKVLAALPPALQPVP
jgi:hypothetical protein